MLGLGVLAVAAYAWDSSKSERIAQGVKIGSIAVGGMDADEARQLIRKDLVRPLDKPLNVTFRDRHFTLPPERLEIRADIEGMVDSAVEVSREGGLPSRLWRYATGAEVTETVPPRISYSTQVLGQFIDGVVSQINREPRDASIKPTASSIEPVPAEEGLEVDVGELRSQLEAALQSPDYRTVEAEVSTLMPEVTTNELADKYPVYLTINRSAFTLRLYEDLKLVKSYPIAVGAIGWDTPAGEYSIQNKAVDPAWSVPEWGGELAGKVIPGGAPNNPLKARWLGIFDGAGIHGTDATYSLGTAASHGCIRMAIPDVIELYDQVPVGTPIYIG